jgi:hypothetical protein
LVPARERDRRAGVAKPMARAAKTKRKKAKTTKKAGRRWSARVTRESDALDLKKRIFAQSSPKKIAASLKRSAERSHRRKSEPYRSAMSMLTFYINRAGGNLSARRRHILEKAKQELRVQFGRA